MKRADMWTAAETRKLRELYSRHKTPEIARLLGRTAKAIASRAKVLGIQKAIGCGGRVKWSRSSEKFLRSTYPHIATKEIAEALELPLHVVFQKAKRLGLEKTQAYLDSPAACRLRRGDNVGAAFRFKPGQVPPNKGLRRPGYSPGRMASTRFKKGERAGAAQRKWVPVGTVRMNTDGYLRRKIADQPEAIAGKGAHSTNWEFVHRRVWEDAHGPIPAGYRIWWKDGNHENCALENLELLSGAEHMARTTIQNFPPALKQVIQLTGALKRKIRNREKKANGEEHTAGSTGSPVCDARSAIG